MFLDVLQADALQIVVSPDPRSPGSTGGHPVLPGLCL